MTLMFAITFLFLAWEFTNIPAWFAKFSFLSMTTENRVRSAIDFAQLLMIFRGLTLIKNFPTPFVRIILAATIAILSVFAIYSLMPDWFGIKKAFFVFVFTSLSIFLFLSPMNRKNFAVLAILMLGIGATINPINFGVDVIKKMPVGQKISEIVQQDKKSLWLVVDNGVSLNDFPIMFGAPTINSVNVYPVLERWKKLDPEEKYFKIYNRYAHINIILQKEMPTNFSANRSDVFDLNLNPADLTKLEVKYIFSRNGELENFSTPQLKIQKIYEDAGSFIYKVS